MGNERKKNDRSERKVDREKRKQKTEAEDLYDAGKRKRIVEIVTTYNTAVIRHERPYQQLTQPGHDSHAKEGIYCTYTVCYETDDSSANCSGKVENRDRKG